MSIESTTFFSNQLDQMLRDHPDIALAQMLQDYLYAEDERRIDLFTAAVSLLVLERLRGPNHERFVN